jgi:hypothetical protein
MNITIIGIKNKNDVDSSFIIRKILVICNINLGEHILLLNAISLVQNIGFFIIESGVEVSNF